MGTPPSYPLGLPRLRVSGVWKPLIIMEPSQTPKRKRCRKCGLERPLHEFPRNRSTADGYRARCKPCHAADVRDWTRAKPERQERVRKRTKAWREKNRERHRANERRRRAERMESDPEYRRAVRERSHRYRERHADRRAAAYRKWARENPERGRARNRLWAERHREKTRQKVRAWRTKNPDKARDLWRVNKARRRARLYQAPGGSNRTQLRDRWEYYGGRCWICGEEATSIDHVIPLFEGRIELASEPSARLLRVQQQQGRSDVPSPMKLRRSGVPPNRSRATSPRCSKSGS